VTLFYTLPTIAKEVYQWVDNEGNVQFSESAPVNGKLKVEKIIMEDFQTTPNTIPTAPPASTPDAVPIAAETVKVPTHQSPAIPAEITRPKHIDIPTVVSDEQRIENLKNSLKVVCDEHAAGSMEKLQCQQRLQTHVQRRCVEEKDPISRQAYCSLATQTQ
jgi:hypothetical protein